MTDAEKLNLLARYFDKLSETRYDWIDDEVQVDLRMMATKLELYWNGNIPDGAMVG